MKLAPIVAGLMGAALCASCATKPKTPVVQYSAPSTARVRTGIAQAAAKVTEVRGNLKGARENVAAAQEEARVIIGAIGEDLRPQMEALEMRLTMALREVEEADARSSMAEETLRQAEGETDRLRGEIDAQTAALNAEAAAKNTALAEATKEAAARKVQTGLAWKWRLIALGEALLVAGFFVARQYLPFLKIL